MLLCSVLAPHQHTAAQTPPSFDDVWDAIRASYTASLEREGVVGSSLLVLHEGTPVAWETYGFADLKTQRPVDAETIYHWASITKTFTGIAVMQLRDRGLLALDDPIIDYLPELKAVHNPFGPMHAITIRHAMSHSAGFRSPTWPWGGDKDWHPHEPATWDQLVAMMPYTEIHFEPDTRFSYSNPTIIFLGRIIEQVTGDDYEVYVDKNILRPLGMHRSYFDHTPYHLLKYRSNNYYVTNGTPSPNGLDFDTGITVSNGGLNAPLGDMAKYLAFLTGTGEPDLKATHEGVLARSSLEEMWRPRHEAGTFGPYQQRIALTYFTMEQDGFRVIGHTGTQKGFLSFFYVDPATRTGVIAVTNTDGRDDSGPDTRGLLDALRERIFNEVFPLFGQD